MGMGDEIMATGIAKKLHAETGAKVAFGNPKGQLKPNIYPAMHAHNPKIIKNEEELREAEKVVWDSYCKGNRTYIANITTAKKEKRYKWNYDFKALPGEFFYTSEELKKYKNNAVKEKYIVVEPHSKQGGAADNKQWLWKRFQEVVNILSKDIKVYQPHYGKPQLKNTTPVISKGLRMLSLFLKDSAAFLCNEGGVHHTAATVEAKGVVIFGGFIPPEITGYDFHTNLFTGGEACGSRYSCKHCKAAMEAIGVDEVVEHMRKIIDV